MNLLRRKRTGKLRGILLQAGAVALLGGITVVCLPLVWARMVVSEEQPIERVEETDQLDY